MQSRDHIAAGSPGDWLVRARSSLSRAMAICPPDSLPEDSCFDAQQAAEKALKAVLVFHRIQFGFTHDISDLIGTLKRSGISVPEAIGDAAVLTEYAVQTRYPGAYEPVTEDEHQDAIRLAQIVVAWSSGIIEGKSA
jgi:HEPN domain-containing protein